MLDTWRQDRKRKKKQPEHRPSLLVVPKSLIFNWQAEAAKFAPRLRMLDFSGIGREALRDQIAEFDVVLTTYGTLRRDITWLREIQFDYAILDEAQAIKNADSQTAKATRLIRADHRLALSGTPVENRLSDLWSIFEFLNPGMLGSSQAFAELGNEGEKESLERLSKALRPLLLRRTKQQVLKDLPEKTEQTLFCEMEGRQREIYAERWDQEIENSCA
jgi:SNF2 family DNA or RNA helicase